jgi:hypothetical protein
MIAKMKNALLLLPCLMILFQSTVSAQNSAVQPRKWGIETELVQPFLPTVNIARIQATYTLTAPEKRRGDLVLGAYMRPNVKHDVVEKINEYMAVVGYRQYLWKGLNLEGKSNMGYAWGTKNLFDGKDYHTPTWFWEANIGYKVDFLKKQKNNLYAIAQFGAIGNIVADIGPRGGKPDTFLQGNLLVGIHF